MRRSVTTGTNQFRELNGTYFNSSRQIERQYGLCQRVSNRFKTYACYYMFSLIYNAAMLAFYVVQTFASHHPCLTKLGHNITDYFDNVFLIGFIVLSADAFNSNFLHVYFRFQVQIEERKFGIVTTSTRRLALTCTYVEWALRSSLLAVSLLQSMVIHSTKGEYCIYSLGVLRLEGSWISWLILFQTVKVVVFSIW